MRITAWPADRARLLAYGEMSMTIYSGDDPLAVSQGAYLSLCASAELMGLALTEPIVEAGWRDCWGGAMVTTRAGVYDPEE